MEDRFVYEKPEDEKLYEEMRRKSLEGKPTTRRKKHIKIDKKKFIRALAVSLGIVVSFSIGAHTLAKKLIALETNRTGGKIVEEIKNNSIHRTLFDEYRKEVFNPAKQHVNGTVSDWSIDYNLLAQDINEATDKDIEIYLAYLAFKSENITDVMNQMDQVIANTDLNYDTFNDYLRARNYDDVEQFEEDSKQEIIIISKGEDDKMIIQNMNNNHPKITDVEKGEKSL